jgi:hypothetical protein
VPSVNRSEECQKPEEFELAWLRRWRLFPQVDGFQQSQSVARIDVIWQLSTWQSVDSDPHVLLRQHSDVPVRYPVWSRYWLPSTVTSSNLPILKVWRTPMDLFFTVTNLSNHSPSDVQHASSHCETEWPQELYAQLLNRTNDLPGHFCGLTCYSFSAAVSLRRAIFSKNVSSLLAQAEETVVDGEGSEPVRS